MTKIKKLCVSLVIAVFLVCFPARSQAHQGHKHYRIRPHRPFVIKRPAHKRFTR